MTAALTGTVQTDPANIVIQPVVSSSDYADLGAQLTAAGMDQVRIRAIIRMVTEKTQQAAEQVALGVAAAIVQELVGVHQTTAQLIATDIQNRNPGGGILGLHNECVRIALRYGNQAPRNLVARG